MTDLTRRRARAIAAGVIALAGALVFRMKLGADPKPVAWIPVIGPVVAALLVQLPSLGPQLLARGLWWSNVVLGVILVFAGTRNEWWASARLMPYSLLLLMFRLGYQPERAARARSYADRAIASGNPAIDFVGIGGGAFLRPDDVG